MKKILAYLLLLALSSQCLYQLDCYVLFKLNQDYIAKNLCINRNKPKLNCKGKCLLMKKIKEAQDKQEQQNVKNIEVFLWVNNQVFVFQKITYHKAEKLKTLFVEKIYQQPSFPIPTPPPNMCIVS